MSGAVNQSEHMFVEWSQGIQADNYDVERVVSLLNSLENENLHGLDIGGGIGRYAQLVCDAVPGCKITVLDKSELAEDAFVNDPRLELEAGDYFDYTPPHKYDFVIFKTVLHHFIADNEKTTTELQRSALNKARALLRPGGLLLIEENYYQGLMGGDLPGRLIYFVTRQQWVEDLVRRLGANTAGEGVRFRAFNSWRSLIEDEGFALASLECSPTWGQRWAWWQRIPLLSSGRFQGVLEARVRPVESIVQPIATQSLLASFPSLDLVGGFRGLVARARNSRWRYVIAICALTGPAVSTCTLAEL